MTSNPARRDTAVPVVPGMAAQLRRVALHEETAALLELRATRVGTEHLAAPLRRRAAEHRREAQGLRAELASAARDARRKSGSVGTGSATAAP